MFILSLNLLLAVGEFVPLQNSSTTIDLHSDKTLSPNIVQDLQILGAGDSISVSKYNATMQATYDVVVNRCSTCHGMKETFQSKELLPSYWEHIVPDMANRPNSGIPSSDIGPITDFLIYDSAKRRSFKLKREMKNLDEAQRAKEQAKIDAILQKYPD